MQDQFQPAADSVALRVPDEGTQHVNEDAFSWSEPISGFHLKPLFEDGERRTYLVKMDPGASCEPHVHDEIEHIYVLEGTFSDEGSEYREGDLVVRAAGATHIAASKSGALVLVTYLPA